MSSHEIDTVVLGVPCTIQYDYQPYEPAERGPEAQYPGCPESVDIVSVSVGGVCVDEWVDHPISRVWFVDAVHDYLERQEELKEESKADYDNNRDFFSYYP